MTLPRRLASPGLCLLASSTVVLGIACGSQGGSPKGASPPTGPTMTCPAPIGVVPKEDCAAVAADFGQLTVGGAIPLAGTGKDAEQKLEAIHAVDRLAQSIKEQRLKLCDEYVHCRVAADEHDARDKTLSQAYSALFDLWNKRRFSRPDEVIRFHEAVRQLDRRVNGGIEGPAVQLEPARTVKAEVAFARVDQPDVAFRAARGSVTVSATTDREREALLSTPDGLPLSAGHHYRINVAGSYAPSVAPAIKPGDEITVRIKYKAEREGLIAVALRSLEDPDATDASETLHVAAREAATKEIKLTADPRQTGFSVSVLVTGTPAEIGALEVLRDGKPILTAKPGDAAVHTDCATKGRAFGCKPGTGGDRITLGQPAGYLVLGLRDGAGKRASTRTQSLEGGRSLDGLVGDDARITVALVGAGSATIDQVEVTDLGN